MHQDYHYFPYEKNSMIAIFVHLDDSDVENGGLAVFPGSHKMGPLKDMSKITSVLGEPTSASFPLFSFLWKKIRKN